VTEAGRRVLIRLMEEAAVGGLRGVPPMPELASELFGETGWLRRMAGLVPYPDLAEAAAGAEDEWNRQVLRLLDQLEAVEAAAAKLDESDPGYADYRRALRAEVDVLDTAVRDISRRGARGFLAEVGLLDDAPVAVPEPTLTDQFVTLLGEWAGEGGGVVWSDGLRLPRRGGGVTHWQVSRSAGGLVLRRLDAAPVEVAVFLDSYGENAVPAGRLADAAVERGRLRAMGTVVFQLTADDAEGAPTAVGAPYEGNAQEAARRGYRILGGDPAELAGMIWDGGAGLLRAFLTDPEPERWRRAATAALAGLLARPGGWRIGVSAETFGTLVRASLLGEVLPAGPGQERILARVLDGRGCPVTLVIDQRRSGPSAPLGWWAGLVVIDDRLVTIRASQASHRRRWAGWLYWGNLLQFLPDGRQLAYTRLGEFDPGTLEAADGTPTAQGRRLDSAWGGQVEVIDREVAVLGHALEFLGVPPPMPDQVGYELGEEAWLAELAWPDARVAVLAGSGEAAETTAGFQAAGWDARLARDWPPDELSARIRESRGPEVPSG
jgi:hypothetical protein